MRSVHGSAGWGFLEPVLVAVALLALIRVTVLGVRYRTRGARPLRERLPAPARRAIAVLGLTVPLSASPLLASGRLSAYPSRDSRPLPEAPWLGTSGFPPPHPLVPSGSDAGTGALHPAIHGDMLPEGSHTALFERAGDRKKRERQRAMRLHPSGSPEPVRIVEERRVTVRSGDCLWAIAAEVLGTDDPAQIDSYWRSIFKANRSVIGDDPDLLVPGQVLGLPREA